MRAGKSTSWCPVAPPRGGAIYTEINPRLQAPAIALGGPITYLEKEDGEKADLIQQQVVMRPWVWKAKAMGK